MPPAPTLISVRLVRFKGFRDCTVPLKGTSVLVGANNAGKSSVISGLRLVAAMIPQMRRLEPQAGGEVDGIALRGWHLTNAAVEGASFTDENVRHEFGSQETRFEARFDSGSTAAIVWPDRDETDATAATCHVIPPKGYRGSYRAAARDLLPSIGVVPTLAPLDDREQVITDEALRRNLTSRRTSRYFRNALLRVTEDSRQWDELIDFLLTNTPEIDRLELARATGGRADELDLYYREAGRRQQREATWAGDGLQIWLQALFHIWRERDATVLVLDEPDVYLHPDLQRRLAHLVFSRPQQIVLATHSTEILAEAEPGAAVWLDRGRKRAERPKPDGALSVIGRRLGSGLELSIARALRSSVALFVEGQDMRVLTSIGTTLGAANLAAGRDYSVVSLGGLSRYGVAGAFSEVVSALGGRVSVQVLLDRDLRSAHAASAIARELVDQGATVHMWKRRELENYLLAPNAIANAVGLEASTCLGLLETAVEGLRQDTLTALQTQRLEERGRGYGVTKATATKTVLEAANREFEQGWRTASGRLALVDAKKVIHALNAQLQEQGVRTISSDRLAHHLGIDEIPSEMSSILMSIESAITTG